MVNCGIYAAFCYVKENIDGYKSLGPNFDEQFQRLGFLKSNEQCGDNGIALRMQYNMIACVILGYNQLNWGTTDKVRCTRHVALQAFQLHYILDR